MLLEALGKKRDFCGLELGGNNLGDDGAKKLAALLEKAPKLRWLGLSSNNIGDEGVAALADSIERSRGVSFLDLSTGKLNVCRGQLRRTCGGSAHC